MPRNFCLQLSAFLLLATFASTANACCLLPCLNPFAWLCGYGYGYGCGGYPGSCCGWYAPGSGYGYGGYGYRTGYTGWPGSAWTPAWSSAPATVFPSSAAVPGSPATSWAPSIPASSYPAWQPQPWITVPTTAWSPQASWPMTTSLPSPTTRWSATVTTAPVYRPAWNPAVSATPGITPDAGDIAGDHEYSVIPNSFQGPVPAQRVGFQSAPAGFGVRLRAPRRYSQTVR